MHKIRVRTQLIHKQVFVTAINRLPKKIPKLEQAFICDAVGLDEIITRAAVTVSELDVKGSAPLSPSLGVVISLPPFLG